jgi:hypothetical protein
MRRLQSPLLPLTLDTSAPPPALFSPLSPFTKFTFEVTANFLRPRKTRGRATLFALLMILFIPAYLFCLAQPTLTLTSIALRRNSIAIEPLAVAVNVPRNPPVSNKRYEVKQQFQLDSAQELAAVSSFLASLPQNVIPPSVDPSLPIDPQLVLDFDTRGPRAAEEVRAMIEDVWLRNPVILYSKVYFLR